MDLDPDNFDETILPLTPDNNKLWIVEFYSVSCTILEVSVALGHARPLPMTYPSLLPPRLWVDGFSLPHHDM
jgi:hypothetical protein